MISVVVPAYRQAIFIEACLDSIAVQQHDDLEVIVVDDGCPEGSGDVAAAHPIAPTVIRQDNAGAAAARNRGIEAARGDHIAFIDADDRWLRGKLSAQLAALGDEPALSFTRYRRRRSDGAPVDNPLHPGFDQPVSFRELTRRNFIGCSTVMLHRACIDSVGGFPDDAALRRGGQDYALWLRVASRFPLRYVPEVLTEYTVHPGNRVGTDAVKHFEGWAHAIRSFERWAPGTIASPKKLIHARARYMLADVIAKPRMYSRAWAAYRAALS